MADLRQLQKPSDSSKLRARGYSYERSVVAETENSGGKEFIGFLGPRGAGKTVALLQQYATGPTYSKRQPFPQLQSFPPLMLRRDTPKL